MTAPRARAASLAPETFDEVDATFASMVIRTDNNARELLADLRKGRFSQYREEDATRLLRVLEDFLGERTHVQ
jgi:hypothetical protein